MKHPLIVYIIACLWCWGTLAPLSGVPLWVLLSGESNASEPANPINHAVFSGSQYLRVSSSNPSGLADGKTGTVSFWAYFNADLTAYRIVDISWNSTGPRFAVSRSATTNRISFVGFNAGGTIILQIATTTGVTVSNGWVHVMACWNLATPGARHIYLNGVAETVVETVYTDQNIDYWVTNETRITIGGDYQASPSLLHNGGLGEFWFNDSFNNVIGDYYNAGKAVPLGANGELPTGSSPVIYLSSSGTGNSWTTNNGTGGSLSKTGTLTTDVDPPDYDE